MFCAYCGKKLKAIGRPCENCGNIAEPLRKFSRLETDTSKIGITAKYETEFIPCSAEERFAEASARKPREGNKLKKYGVCALLVLCAVLAVIFAIKAVIAEWRLDSVRALPISEKSYLISGTAVIENAACKIVLDNEITVSVNDMDYSVKEIYLPPNTKCPDSENGAEIFGRVYVLGENQYMLVAD